MSLKFKVERLKENLDVEACRLDICEQLEDFHAALASITALEWENDYKSCLCFVQRGGVRVIPFITFGGCIRKDILKQGQREK